MTRASANNAAGRSLALRGAAIPLPSLVLGYAPMALLPVLAVASTATPPLWAYNIILAGHVWAAAILIFIAGVRRGLSFADEGKGAAGPLAAEIAASLCYFAIGLVAILLRGPVRARAADARLRSCGHARSPRGPGAAPAALLRAAATFAGAGRGRRARRPARAARHDLRSARRRRDAWSKLALPFAQASMYSARRASWMRRTESAGTDWRLC